MQTTVVLKVKTGTVIKTVAVIYFAVFTFDAIANHLVPVMEDKIEELKAMKREHSS